MKSNFLVRNRAPDSSSVDQSATSFNPQVGNRIGAPRELRTLERWCFPIGEKVATIYIVGKSPVDVLDIDALIEISKLFRKSIAGRPENNPEPEYHI